MSRSERPTVLMRDFTARILNFSASGCLFESRRRLDVGTVGRLQLTIGGRVCVDDVEVVRCERIPTARTVYHVGLRFLWTSPCALGSIRHAAACQAEEDDCGRGARVM